jgi:hypothetical protein
MGNSTVTVNQVIQYAQQHTALMPLTGVGGVANEPALSIANDTLSELLAEAFPWKFNRAEMPVFVTTPFKQDYKVSGACAFTITGGGVAIDLTTNNGITQSISTVTVKLLESCQNVFNVGDTIYLAGVTQTAIAAVFTPGQGVATSSGWSNGFTITSIATNYLSFTFTYAPAISTDGAPGITDFGWMESATMIQTGNTSVNPTVWYLQAVRNLEPASMVAIPDRISVIQDLGTGILRIRLRYLPSSQPLTISVVYQKKPTLIASTGATWAPFPDNLIFCVRQMFVAMAYRFAESPKEAEEYQKAIAMAVKASGADDREASEEYITPDQSLLRGFGYSSFPF